MPCSVRGKMPMILYQRDNKSPFVMTHSIIFVQVFNHPHLLDGEFSLSLKCLCHEKGSSDRRDKVLLQFKAHIQALPYCHSKGCFPGFQQGRASHNAARQTLTLGLCPYPQNNY